MTTTSPAETFGIDPAVYHRRWYILGCLCLVLVLVVATVSSVNVAIPSLARALRPTDTQILWIVDAYALTFAGLLLFAGALGDRFSRKGALLVGLVVFAAASILCSFSTSPNVLIAFRAVMGAGAALIMPSTLSLLGSVFPMHERAKAIAIWAGFAGAGGAIGPVVAGALLSRYWYGSVFFVAVPIAVVAFLAIAFMAPDSTDAKPAALDPVGAVLSIVGLSSLLFAIIEGPEQGWTSALVVGAFVVAALTLVGFVLWEQRNPEPMLDMVFFRNARFSMSAIGITAMFLAMFATFFVLSQYLQYVRGYSPLKAGVATLPFAAVMIIIAPRSATLAAKVGIRRLLSVGPLIGAIGLALMSLVGETTPYVVLAVFLCLTAAGMALTMPSFTAGLFSSVPPHKAGVGSAVNDTTRELGGAVGIAVIGSVVTAAYRSKVADALDQLPPEAADQARRNVGRAVQVADQLRATDPAAADRFLHGVRDAFVSGGQTGLRVAAAVALVVAVLQAWKYPDGNDVTGAQGH
ncbi:MAG: MFS transporter [Acidimicrobiales bacterium]|nr:MFS transporter [Acidimicrobiales bacterium]